MVRRVGFRETCQPYGDYISLLRRFWVNDVRYSFTVLFTIIPSEIQRRKDPFLSSNLECSLNQPVSQIEMTAMSSKARPIEKLAQAVAKCPTEVLHSITADS